MDFIFMLFDLISEHPYFCLIIFLLSFVIFLQYIFKEFDIDNVRLEYVDFIKYILKNKKIDEDLFVIYDRYRHKISNQNFNSQIKEDYKNFIKED